MAIRIRTVDGIVVALCAAKTKPVEGDIYLDDGIHHALTSKFGIDWKQEGRLNNDLADTKIAGILKTVEQEPNDE